MKILHLTDFHYSEKGKDPSQIIDAIIAELTNNSIQVDLIFFTGDLVNIGGENAPYSKAKEILLDKIADSLGTDKKNIFICPGNHDIDRSKVSSVFKTYINFELNDNEKLNQFYKSKDSANFSNALAPSTPFNQFISTQYGEGGQNVFSNLYTVHYREFDDVKYGIASINTSWFSSIHDDDKGNLLISTEMLREISDLIKNCEQKIILMHHPLYFLKEYNYYEVESIIHSKFNLLFSGHVHKISSSSIHNGTNGIFEHIATASLTHREQQGCSVIEIDDVEDHKIVVREISYNETFGTCKIEAGICHTVPHGEDKEKKLRFRKKVFEKIHSEKENANDLLLLNDNDKNKDFLTLFVHPILKKDSERNLESRNTEAVSLDELLESEENYHILGKDKCGKTSLLRKILISYLMNYPRLGVVPFYIDAKEYESKIDDKFKIETLVRNYYSINTSDVQNHLASNNFILLIDNYSRDSGFATYIAEFATSYPDVRLIVCSEENLTRSVDVTLIDNIIFTKLFFHKMRKQELVQYTDKRLDPSIKRDDVNQKIIALCKQLELPLNYWSISLLLMIHNKSNDSYAKNLFSILDICIDEVFNKKMLLIRRFKISTDQLKKICAELSKVMFRDHMQTVYSMTEQEILETLDAILHDNDRIAIGRNEIFKFLCESGVIKQKYDDRRYTFRLNGFFEYFLAYQMTKDKEFKEQILSNEQLYVAFKNQLEIYSSFIKDDFEFLNTIYTKTTDKLHATFDKYNADSDIELIEKVKAKDEFKTFCKEISVKRTLSVLEKAEIEDQIEEPQINSEVHVIKPINIDNITSEVFERYISILARTYRSLDEISGKKDERMAIFNYIIDGYINLGFNIIEEFEEFARKEFANSSDETIDLQNNPEIRLMSYISNFIPLISQSCLFDGVGHYSLERIIKDEISNILLKENICEYKLFVLCFLLLDIDVEGNKDYIKIVMNSVRIPVLKYAIVIKLNYYLAFKPDISKDYQRLLSNSIQAARLNLDNATDIGSIQKQLQDKKKESLKLSNKF